jgi:hypothetical protein
LHLAVVAFEAGADPAGTGIAVIATNAAAIRKRADVRISWVLHRLPPGTGGVGDCGCRLVLVRPTDRYHIIIQSIDRIAGLYFTSS